MDADIRRRGCCAGASVFVASCARWARACARIRRSSSRVAASTASSPPRVWIPRRCAWRCGDTTSPISRVQRSPSCAGSGTSLPDPGAAGLLRGGLRGRVSHARALRRPAEFQHAPHEGMLGARIELRQPALATAVIEHGEAADDRAAVREHALDSKAETLDQQVLENPTHRYAARFEVGAHVGAELPDRLSIRMPALGLVVGLIPGRFGPNEVDVTPGMLP